jgi:hypothetical protein
VYQPPENQGAPATAPTPPQPEATPTVKNPFPTPPTEPFEHNLTGKWLGRYKVNSPKQCSQVSGGWTAEVKQDGDAFSGTYTSSVVSGRVSGNVSGTKGFSWRVTGGGGAELQGSVTSTNTVEGKFTGPECPATSHPTTGTFFGGREVKQ